jgi:predicted RNA-binding Zn ribbon-like protein
VPSRQPAPYPLGLVEDFVNTSEIDGVQRDELLVTARDLGTWLEERGLLEPGVQLDEGDRARAIELREDLRALLLANNDETLDDAALDRVNSVARRAPVCVQFAGPNDGELQPATTGLDGAFARILAIVQQAMVEGTWARLKACRNDECMWVFYDTSKNHSATWCSMRACGNRMKARAYRRRRAADHA